jgi:hypothetical protein
MVSSLSRLSEASATSLMRRAAVQASAALPRLHIKIEAKLGRNRHLAAKRRERFAYQLFVGE